jgi:predicted CXXCH cytochrome family protein
LLDTGTKLCLDCHISTKRQLETMRSVHGPAAVDCQACHVAHASNHDMILRKQPKQLCLDCHETIHHTLETAKTQHEAVTTGRACLNCHSPHASDEPAVLRGSMLDLCLECHDREIEMPDGRKLANIKAVLDAGPSLHGPVAQANCAACHLIHGGDNFRLLINEYPPQFYAPFAEESYALCFMCHEPQIVRDEKTTTLTNFRNGDENLHYRHVHREKGRTCRACHETHASKTPKHIRDAVPFGTGGWMLPIAYKQTDTGGNCAPGCHRAYAYDRLSPVDNVPPTTDEGVAP